MTEAASNAEGEAMPEEKVIEEVEVETTETETEKENKPAPETMPTAAHIAQKNKWKERIDKTEREAEAKDRELELLRLQVKTPEVVTAPNELDFDNPKEYQQALDKYVETKAQASAKQVLEQYSKTEAQKVAQADYEQRFEQGLDAHYKSAADLKADDFSDTENIARQILGDEVSKEVITRYTGTSAAMLYSLGKKPEEAQRLKEMFATDPTGLVIELTRLSDRLSAAPKTLNAPPPDEPLEGGQASTMTWEKRIEKARADQIAGKISMNELIGLKREARVAGVKS